MINLKLVKTKLLTDKFCTYKDVRRERKPEKPDCARCATKHLASDHDLAVTVKIRGFVFEYSGSHVIDDIESGTPSNKLSAGRSFVDVVYQDSFTMWLQAKALSESDSTHRKLAIRRLIDSYLASDSQLEEDTSNVMSLDAQAEQLALDVLQGEEASLCRDPSRSDAEIERFLGVTSSAVFQSLNPDASLHCQSVRQDSLFEIIMQTLVEKELQEFYPDKVEQLGPETELQALDLDQVQQLGLETDKTELLVRDEGSGDSWVTALEEDDQPSPCLMRLASVTSESSRSASPEIIVRLGSLNVRMNTYLVLLGSTVVHAQVFFTRGTHFSEMF